MNLGIWKILSCLTFLLWSLNLEILNENLHGDLKNNFIFRGKNKNRKKPILKQSYKKSVINFDLAFSYIFDSHGAWISISF